MNTIVVWILIVQFQTYYTKTPLIVDDIATQLNCEVLGRSVTSAFINQNKFNSGAYYDYKCLAVTKVIKR